MIKQNESDLGKFFPIHMHNSLWETRLHRVAFHVRSRPHILPEIDNDNMWCDQAKWAGSGKYWYWIAKKTSTTTSLQLVFICFENMQIPHNFSTGCLILIGFLAKWGLQMTLQSWKVQNVICSNSDSFWINLSTYVYDNICDLPYHKAKTFFFF